MGAWDCNCFDNDTALDFLEELQDNGNPCEFIKFVIENTNHGDDFLDSDDAQELIAGCGMLDCALNGTPFSGEIKPAFFDALVEKVKKNKDILNIAHLGAEVLPLVLNEDNSELCQLWKDTDSFSVWQQGIFKLIENLG